MLRNLKANIVERLYAYHEGKAVRPPEYFLSNLGFEYREPEIELSQERINGLMTLLRKTPWWAKGHLRLGWLALGIKEIELSFASFEAVRRLKVNPTLLGNASIGLARCYLAKGAYQRAIDHINGLPEDLLSDDYIKVQLGACYMAQERYEDAQKILEKIPQSNRSAEVLGILDYLQKRQNEKS